MIASMAAFNVMLGRYKIVPKEIKDLVLGKYGRTPAPIDAEIQQLIIGDQQPISHRPADDILPQLETLKQELPERGYPAAPIEDVLSYALFPEVALDYFALRILNN